MIKYLKIILFIVVILIISAAIFLVYATIADYKPNEIEDIVVFKNEEALEVKNDLTLMSWNLGYGGLDKSQNFFMDGGQKVLVENKETILENLNGIEKILTENPSDIYLFQEVDINSKRTFKINEYERLKKLKIGYDSTFAYNYKVSYIPYPWPNLGHIESGLASFSKYRIEDSKRYQFPGNYSWPKKLGFLDRCFVENIIKIENSDKKLIVINTHNSAYDSTGKLRKQQLDYLKNHLSESYENGDYIIVGGDWNHILPEIQIETFKTKESAPTWVRFMESDWILDDWKWGSSSQVPTVRALNKAFVKGENFMTVIDGFLVSPNIEIKTIKNLDLNFQNSDHNPVVISVKLKEK